MASSAGSLASPSYGAINRARLRGGIDNFKRGLSKFVEMFSGRYGLRLIFRGTSAHTNGKTIYIPELSIFDRQGMTDAELAEAHEFLMTTCGFVYHESAHVMFTTFNAKEHRKNRGLHLLWNALEDGRIEKKIGDAYPGAREAIAFMHLWVERKVMRMVERGRAGETTDALKLTAASELLYGIITILHSPQSYRQRGYWSLLKPETIAFCETHRLLILQALSAPDSATVLKIARKLYKLATPPPPPKPPKPPAPPPPPAAAQQEDEEDGSDPDPGPDSTGTGTDDEESDPGDFAPVVGEPGEEQPEDDAGDDAEAADPDDGVDAAGGDAGVDRDDSPLDFEGSDRDEGGDAGDEDDAGSDVDPDDDFAGAEEDLGGVDGEGADGESGDIGGGDEDEPLGGGDLDDAGDADAGDPDPAGGVDADGDSDRGPGDGDGDGAADDPLSEDETSLTLEEEYKPFDPDAEDPADTGVDLKQLLSEEAATAAQKLIGTLDRPYLIYTTEHDRVGKPMPMNAYQRRDAEEWARREKDRAQASYGVIERNLRSMLLSANKSYHVGGQTSGTLHRGSLHRLAAGGPSATKVFRQQFESKRLDDVVLHFLIDRSGSMGAYSHYHGPTRMEMCVATLMAFGYPLHNLSIPFGVSAYTTADTETNRSNLPPGERDLYSRYGSLDLKLYKDADEAWPTVTHRLRQMQPYGNSLEGEALVWATKWLQRQPQRRKILIVLADGAPQPQGCDDRYTQVQYLHQVIREIRESRAAEVVGIGMAMPEIRQYYGAASPVVLDMATLPDVVSGSLKQLLLKGAS